MFSPDSSVRLLNMQIDPELRSTLWFPDRNTQTNWFLSQTDFMSFTDYSYVKKDNTIVLACREEDIWRFNYVMYQNSNFSNKWFYAFIVRREWASDYSTRIYLKTDPLQTWMFDWVLKTSFVTRQHSTTDVAGDNIVPEPFQSSTPLQQMAGTVDCEPDWYMVYATSGPNGEEIGGKKQGGLFSGCGNVFSDNYTTPANFLNQYVTNGTASAVTRIQQVCSFGDEVGPTNVKEYTFSKYPANIDGYTPKNNKLLSGAFCKGFAAGFGHKVEFIPDFCGGSQVYMRILQDYTTGTLYIYISNEGLQSGNYENMGVGFQVTIPECTWAYNQFKNDWNLHSVSNSMMQQRMGVLRNIEGRNARAGAVGSIFSGIEGLWGGTSAAISGAASGSFDTGGLLSGWLNALNTNNQRADEAALYESGIDEISQQLTRFVEDYNAPAVGAVAQSNAFVAAQKTVVSYGWEVPDARMAKCYDDFLTVYGYAQNQYMVPNLHARQSWTYIKVAELMADCNCPAEDEVMIRAAFNRGIFFWAYTANYGDFSQNNGIV